jgi:hypothetical protein
MTLAYIAKPFMESSQKEKDGDVTGQGLIPK